MDNSIHDTSNKESGAYDNYGRKDGLWMIHNEDGILIEKGHYCKGKKTGIWEDFDPFTENSLCSSTTYEDDKKEGGFTSFYSDGSKKIEGRYRNDLPDSYWHGYDVNDNIERKEYYTEGKRQGEWEYYVNGQLIWINKYSDGNPEGLHKIFRYNITVVEGNYSAGKKNGIWKYYHDSGELGVKGMYSDNLMEGKWEFYNKTGDLEGEAFFDKDIVVSSWGEIGENEEEIMDYCETLYF